MTLRPMRWWDIAPVLELERALFADQPWSAESFWAELALGADRVYVVAEDGDDVVGYAGLSCPADARGGDAEVMTVAVASDAQGHGVGRALVSALVDSAAERGARRLLLEVRADNVPARNLYAAMGFEQLAVRTGYYPVTDAAGRSAAPVDALILAKRLPAVVAPAAAADSLTP